MGKDRDCKNQKRHGKDRHCKEGNIWITKGKDRKDSSGFRSGGMIRGDDTPSWRPKGPKAIQKALTWVAAGACERKPTGKQGRNRERESQKKKERSDRGRDNTTRAKTVTPDWA